MQSDDERMLTTSEVARALGYTSQGARGLCERGVLPRAFQVGPGGPWRIPEGDVQAIRQAARAVRRRKQEA